MRDCHHGSPFFLCRKIPGERRSGEYKYHFTRNTHGPARTCSMHHARAGADPSRTVRQHPPKTPSESTSCQIPPDAAVVSLQDALQIISFNIYYTQLNGKIKMTMQEIMKKCFFFVLAFCLAGSLFFVPTCSLQGRGMQGAAGDGGCGWEGVPKGIRQVNRQDRHRWRKSPATRAGCSRNPLQSRGGESPASAGSIHR